MDEKKISDYKVKVCQWCGYKIGKRPHRSILTDKPILGSNRIVFHADKVTSPHNTKDIISCYDLWVASEIEWRKAIGEPQRENL